MNARITRVLQGSLAVSAMLLAGCTPTGTTIESDLVLAGSSAARLDLYEKTDAIDLFNTSDGTGRIRVLGHKDEVISNMTLGSQEQVRLHTEPAHAVEFQNDGDVQAIVRWILNRDDRVEYSMAVSP